MGKIYLIHPHHWIALELSSSSSAGFDQRPSWLGSWQSFSGLQLLCSTCVWSCIYAPVEHSGPADLGLELLHNSCSLRILEELLTSRFWCSCLPCYQPWSFMRVRHFLLLCVTWLMKHLLGIFRLPRRKLYEDIFLHTFNVWITKSLEHLTTHATLLNRRKRTGGFRIKMQGYRYLIGLGLHGRFGERLYCWLCSLRRITGYQFKQLLPFTQLCVYTWLKFLGIQPILL